MNVLTTVLNRASIVSIAVLLIAGCAGPESHVADAPEAAEGEALIFGSTGLRELWEARQARRSEVIERWLRRLCTNRDGSYKCACDPWFNPDAVDCDGGAVNECALGTDNCSDDATCTNTADAFSCACNAGYEGDGVTCADVDECAIGSDDCDPQASCSNEPGSFSCECPAGTTDTNGDGSECTIECDAAACDPIASCSVEGGVSVCTCPAGYADTSGDGSQCDDIDECGTGADNCSANATCTNAAGTFTCACSAGYAGDGVTCTAIDQCADNDCDVNARCEATATSHVCTCNAGYTGDGVSCTDVNECSANTDNCNANATCTNTPGAFTCACNAGYTGNGVTCTTAGCNLTGTFAMLTELDIEWEAVTFGSTVVLAGGSDTVYSYAIRKLTQSGTSVTADVTSCQGSSPDICSPLFGEAYAQVLPDSIWDRPTMPVTHVSMTVDASPQPGDPFVSPDEATLLGVTMADPFAPWPESYSDPLLTWVDHDGDMKVGVTSIMLAGSQSAACALPYADLPIPSSGARAHEVYTGSRTIAGLDGTLVSCDVIQGELTGPNDGMPLLQGHVGGCLRPDGACTAGEISSLDSGASGTAQTILGARFTMVRVADGITCAQMSTVTFPSL